MHPQINDLVYPVLSYGLVLQERLGRGEALEIATEQGRLIGLLQSDIASYLVQAPKWTPKLPYAGASFRMTDFLTFAGVDPVSRGQ